MRGSIFVGLAMAMVSGCVTGPERAGQRAGVAVIAHRGASAYAPENTLAAFARAVEQGADWFELDCHLTADREAIVIHDGTLDRTTSGEGPVRAQTVEALKQLDAGAWFSPEFAGEQLPTLSEALQFARGKIGVYVEIKSADDDADLFAAMRAAAGGADRLSQRLRLELMDRVHNSGTRNLALTRAAIAAIRAERMQREVVIQSFSPVVCFIALTEAPELRTELLINRDKNKPEHWDQMVAFGMLIGVHGFNAQHETLSAETVRNFQQAGKTVAVWTVDDPGIMRQMIGYGVNALITNKPDVARELLQSGG